MKLIKALCIYLLGPVAFLSAEPNDIWRIQQVSSTFRSVVKKVKPSVVYIEVYKENGGISSPYTGRSSGSGVIIDAQKGYVLTAYHVIENVSRLKVKLADGSELLGTGIRGDVQTDVAIFKIDANNLSPASLGNSDEIEVGDWVLAIGSPFGAALENSVSAGIVSAKGRRTNVLGKMGIENYIQTDAVINKGNSGGPLVNIKGEVIGINSNIISSTGMYAGLGFAVPSNMIKPVLERLVNEGKVVRGWLGVIIASMAEAKEKMPEGVFAAGGVCVIDIIEGGPGEKGGLKKGDIITAIDGKSVKDTFELINDVSWKRPGQTAVCSLFRDGVAMNVPVKLGKRPDSDERTTRTVEIEQDTPSLKKLGMSVADLDIQVSQGTADSHIKAAIVLRVEDGSVAHLHKLEVGDIITKINEKPVQNAKDFHRIFSELDLDEMIRFTVLNSNGESTVFIQPGEITDIR